LIVEKMDLDENEIHPYNNKVPLIFGFMAGRAVNSEINP
jgi:hypothetical protein